MQTIFWDMDGTLIESEDLYTRAVDIFAENHKLPPLPHMPDGMGLDYVFSLFGKIDVPYIAFEKEVNETVAGLLPLLKKTLRPHVLETLSALKNLNIPMFVVSNTVRYQIIKTLEAMDVLSYFDHIIGRDEVARGKPFPDPYLAAITLSGLNADQCLAIEDTTVGIEAASSAGLKVVAFPNSRTRSSDFSKASYVMQDIRGVLELVAEAQ